MKFQMSAPEQTGRGQWVVYVWHGHLAKRRQRPQFWASCYGDSRLQAISRGLKLRRCLK